LSGRSEIVRLVAPEPGPFRRLPRVTGDRRSLLLAFHQPLILLVLAYGFLTRALAGPKISPLARFSVHVITPRLNVAPKYTAGPPKRFAQSLGAIMTVAGVVLTFGFGLTAAAYVVAGIVVALASLESIVGLCIGCQIFRLLMVMHLIPETVCEECANIWLRSEPAGSDIAPLH